jgi:hypothetical protein
MGIVLDVGAHIGWCIVLFTKLVGPKGRTIDEYVVAAALSRVDLIKLDVEGAEGRCCAGAAKALERYGRSSSQRPMRLASNG